MTFVLLLPALWWLAQAVPPLFYFGWDYDPRFFQIYWPGLVVTRWLSERNGQWLGPAWAVVLQDLVSALLISLLVSFILVRWRLWQADRRLHLAFGIASLTLPWFGGVRPWQDSDPYSAAVVSLMVGYFGCVFVALGFRISPFMRRALLAIACASAGALLMWRMESWEWLHAGSLLSSIVLAAYAVARGTLMGGEAA